MLFYYKPKDRNILFIFQTTSLAPNFYLLRLIHRENGNYAHNNYFKEPGIGGIINLRPIQRRWV